MLEAILIQMNRDGHPIMDLKIYDEVVYHAFTIKDKEVLYSVYKQRGELIAHSTAEVTDLQESDNHITSMRVRTQAYDFEITPGPDYTYRAYKRLNKI
jgi:hypothetical protein